MTMLVVVLMVTSQDTVVIVIEDCKNVMEDSKNGCFP